MLPFSFARMSMSSSSGILGGHMGWLLIWGRVGVSFGIAVDEAVYNVLAVGSA